MSEVKKGVEVVCVGGKGGGGGSGNKSKRRHVVNSPAETVRSQLRPGSRHIHKHPTLQSKAQTMQNISVFFFLRPTLNYLHSHPPSIPLPT